MNLKIPPPRSRSCDFVAADPQRQTLLTGGRPSRPRPSSWRRPTQHATVVPDEPESSLHPQHDADGAICHKWRMTADSTRRCGSREVRTGHRRFVVEGVMRPGQRRHGNCGSCCRRSSKSAALKIRNETDTADNPMGDVLALVVDWKRRATRPQRSKSGTAPVPVSCPPCISRRHVVPCRNRRCHAGYQRTIRPCRTVRPAAHGGTNRRRHDVHGAEMLSPGCRRGRCWAPSRRIAPAWTDRYAMELDYFPAGRHSCRIAGVCGPPLDRRSGAGGLRLARQSKGG